jgi:hypothetical protein
MSAPNIEQMPREAYDRMLQDIAGGGTPVGEQAMEARLAAEQGVSEDIHNTLGGIVLFGDALHQFYSDTVREFSNQLTTSTPQLQQRFLQWHIVSLARFYAAYDLLKRGYYFESSTLTRTLWEVALTLAGLKKNIVTFEELFGGRIQEGVPIDRQKALDMVKNADKTIQDRLIWKNAVLDKNNRSHLNDFYGLLNQSTHKCNLGLGHLIDLQVRGRPLPTLPEFSNHVMVAWNLMFMATWSLITTLSYLDSLFPAPGASWHVRHQKLIQIYEYNSQHSPSEVVQGFHEIIKKVF